MTAPKNPGRAASLPATLAYAAFGALQLVALVRFATDVDASAPRPALYVALLVAVTVTGALGWWLGRRPVGHVTDGPRAT